MDYLFYNNFKLSTVQYPKKFKFSFKYFIASWLPGHGPSRRLWLGKFQARPKAVSSQQSGWAWLGFFWPGLAWLLA